MNATTTRSGGSPQPAAGRPYLGIYFECCHVYARVYRRPDRNAYVARCPRCLRAARIRVGPDGSQKKFFTAH